jgi:hypothetical protein
MNYTIKLKKKNGWWIFESFALGIYQQYAYYTKKEAMKLFRSKYKGFTIKTI